MNKNEIIKICEETKNEFLRTIDNIKFEDKGIFNSEMLLFVSLAKKFDIEEIWESGRARGQSTKVLSEFFKNYNIRIHSIEIMPETEDDIIAIKRLQRYPNLEILYGDSKKTLIQKLENDKNTFVLVDGPKGTEAIRLAREILKKNNTKAVFLHDYHKDSPLREVVEKTFKNTFFTDDEEYVEKFRDLDDKCWIEHSKIGRYPYMRGERKMKSYSSTLCVIFNEND
ncbi:MAG: hypothetical protein WC346_03475 [Methanogenium sp.]|jgi:hypothetical protein